MQQKRLSALAIALVAALAIACGDNGNPTSPTGSLPRSTGANPDGSTLKVGSPAVNAPAPDSRVDSNRVTLTVNNAALRFASSANLNYQFEMFREDDGQQVLTTVVPQGSGTTSADAGDVDYDVTYRWRARAEWGGAVGPWSDWFTFTGPDAPATAVFRPGSLPFDVPAVCAFGDGPSCGVAVAASSGWYAACVAGSGVNCHRFTRQLAASLAVFDPNWGLISKNPGEQQCSWDWCGPGDGSGYGEDVVAYRTGGGWIGWDVVTGAGAPGASFSWAALPGARAGNNWAPVPPFP